MYTWSLFSWCKLQTDDTVQTRSSRLVSHSSLAIKRQHSREGMLLHWKAQFSNEAKINSTMIFWLAKQTLDMTRHLHLNNRKNVRFTFDLKDTPVLYLGQLFSTVSQLVSQSTFSCCRLRTTTWNPVSEHYWSAFPLKPFEIKHLYYLAANVDQ